jgi:hypothetical protein
MREHAGVHLLISRNRSPEPAAVRPVVSFAGTLPGPDSPGG